MKKQAESKNNTPRPFKAGLLIPAAFFYLFVFESCTAEMIVERFAAHEETEEIIITALVSEPEPVSETEGFSGSNMILESGNYWTAGIPGFGENALSAFAGEYRIPEKTEPVKVWLTMEFVYYDGWTNRDSITRIPVQEKWGNEGQIVALTLNENWTVVMQFPLGSGLSRDDEDRIIMDLVGKFSGFSGQGQNVSLPAIIAY
ncbi:MAG: hypothetical protein FWG29_07055 [Treponema sp.]|nr:hypothetical protein [Treponema sp.]